MVPSRQYGLWAYSDEHGNHTAPHTQFPEHSRSTYDREYEQDMHSYNQQSRGLALDGYRASTNPSPFDQTPDPWSGDIASPSSSTAYAPSYGPFISPSQPHPRFRVAPSSSMELPAEVPQVRWDLFYDQRGNQTYGPDQNINTSINHAPPIPGHTQSWNRIVQSHSPRSALSADDALPRSPLSHYSTPSPTPSQSYLAPAESLSRDRRPSTENVKMCSHCRATTTPLWRRDPTSLKPLCNACGLYLQQRNKLRPQELIDADADESSDDESSDPDGTRPECTHCHTHNTSVWRRSKTGAQLCNACGVYSRLRGKDRPLSLKRKKIKPRSKHVPQK